MSICHAQGYAYGYGLCLWEVKYPAHCSGYVNGSGYDIAEHFRSSNFTFPQVLPLGLELGLVLGLCLDFRVRLRVRSSSRTSKV